MTAYVPRGMNERTVTTFGEDPELYIDRPVRERVDPAAIQRRLEAVNAAQIESTVPPEVYRPKGRPSIRLTDALRSYLAKNPDMLGAVIENTVRDAIAGDAQARKLVWERVDGATPQRIGVGQLSNEQIAEMLELTIEQDELSQD